MSTRRTSAEAGFVAPSRLPTGPNGRALCRRCGEEVPVGRRTFCSDACIHEHRLRSDPSYARNRVFERDSGVCAMCGRDTEDIVKRVNGVAADPDVSSDVERRKMEHLEASLVLADAGYDPDKFLKGAFESLWSGRRQTRLRRSLWDMDHTTPVVEGGGECGLDNLRTLCCPCHKQETAKLARRRALKRSGRQLLPGMEE